MAKSAWKYGREGRTGLDQMLTEVEKGHGGNAVVLVFDLDRLSRDYGVGYRDILHLDQIGVKIADTTHGIYRQDKIEGVIMTVLTLHRAQQESDVKSKRIKAALDRKNGAGYWVSRPPYGYRLKRVGGGKVLEVHEPEARVVRFIYKALLNDDKLSVIVDECRRLDKAKKWHKSTIRATASRRTYAGYKPGDGPLIDGNHPPIIDKSTYHKVQKAKTPRAGRKTAHSRSTTLGLVKCPVCGDYCASSRGKSSNQLGYVRCRKQVYFKECPNSKNISLETINKVVLFYLHSAADAGLIQAADDKPDPEYLEARITALRSQQGRLVEAIATGVHTIQPMVDKLDAVEREVVSLTEELEALSAADDVDIVAQVKGLTEVPPNVQDLINSIKPCRRYKTWTIDGIFGKSQVIV